MCDPAVCSLCDDGPVVVVVNGAPYCAAHIDDGFRFAFRGVAILRGIAEDRLDAVERIGNNMRGELGL